MYSEEINKLSINYSGLELVELSLNNHLARIINKLIRISDEDNKGILSIYLKKYDIYNIKTLLRAKLTNTNFEKVKHMFIPIGNYPIKVLEKLYISSYNEILKNLPYDTQNYTELYDIENKLDFDYFTEIENLRKQLTEKNLVNYLSLMIDTHNVKMILKSLKFNIEKEVIQEYIIIQEKDVFNVKKLLKATSIDKAYKIIQKTKQKRLFDSETILHPEIVLEKYLLEINKKLFHKKPLSADVIFSYLFSKEIEIRNLRIIAKSKVLTLDQKIVESQVIL